MPSSRSISAGLLVAVAYAAIGVATLQLGATGGIELRRVIWCASGVALTVALLVPHQVAWGAAAGGAMASALTGSGPLMVLVTGIANGLEVALARHLLARAQFDARLDRVRDVLLLIGLASGVAALVSAGMSVTGLWVSGGVPPGGGPRILTMWWLTHAMGILVITPVGLAVFGERTGARTGRLAEASFLLVAVAVTTWWPFHTAPDDNAANRLLFLPFPFLLWAALRVGAAVAAMAGALGAAVAIAAAVANSGPLALPTPTDTLVLTWLYVNVAIVPTLITRALVASRARSEAERQEMQSRLVHQQKLESLGVLAGGIAHDFNNLLMAMRARAELIASDDTVTREAREDAEGILTTADQAAGLCRQMLTYAGRGSLAFQALDLNAIVRDMQDLLRTTTQRRVRLEVEFAPQPLWISGDASQLQQVVLNLVSNAAEAADGRPGRGVIRVRTWRGRPAAGWWDRSVTGTDLVDGEHAFLAVEDDGAGMTPEVARQVFDPFFSTKGTGRGLGLSTVLGVSRGHRGALVVESSPGSGSRIVVALPVAGEPAQTDAPARPVRAGTRRAVLVVDDDSEVREGVCRLLQQAGYVAHQAADGAAAVAFATGLVVVDAILLDLTMPGMSGLETLHALRARGIRTPVILASGYTAQALPDETEVQGFVQKPFRRDEVVAAIESALDVSGMKGRGP